MKNIHTLITDIQYLLTQRNWVTDELAGDLGHSVSTRLKEQFVDRTALPKLRLSRMGPQCHCALWHSIHKPHLSEKMPPWAEFKFSFGHIIEAQAIAFTKAAGHLVTGEQDEISVDGISGHRDCVIDGCIVDVKSANDRSYKGFKTKSIDELDTWGYLSQLDGYLLGSQHDPLVTVKDKAYLLVIHKELGHMQLYEHRLRENHIRERIRSHKEIVARSTPPLCTCPTIDDGQSGNVKLAYPATYNTFKFCCFPNLRTFIYSGGPEYFVKVGKVPTYKGLPLLEIDKYGKSVYN